MNIFFALWLSLGLWQEPQAALHALHQQGFENLSIQYADTTLIIASYENRIFRNETLAMGAVAAVLSRAFPDTTTFCLIPVHGGIPLAAIRFKNNDYIEFIKNRQSRREFASKLAVEEYKNQLDPVRFTKRNHTAYGKIDLTFYPGISAQFGNFDDHQKYYMSIIPDLNINLWKGFYFRSQVEIPFWNEIRTYSDEVRPKLIAATQMFRLPKSVFGAVHMGIFPPDRWGVSGELSTFLCQRLFRVGASGDYTGFMLYQDETFTYSSLEQLTYQFYGWIYPHFYDLQVGLNYSKYLLGDKGFGIRLNRLFLDTKIGFEAVKTDQDYFAKIHLSIPLLSQRRSKPGLIRIRPPWRYNWSYYSTSEAETIGKLTETGRRIQTGFSTEAFNKNIVSAYIKNNLDLWKKSNRIVRIKKNKK